MRRPWFMVGFVCLWGLSLPLWAQQSPPEAPMKLAQQQKGQQYAQIEYQRCRADLLEIWVKGDAAEQRVKELEEEVRRVTEELQAFRGAGHAKSAN